MYYVDNSQNKGLATSLIFTYFKPKCNPEPKQSLVRGKVFKIAST